MSSLIIVTASMHKIANVTVPVKYRLPGNVIEYISVAFDIYKNGRKFFAVPLANDAIKILTNLPDEFSFRVQDDRIYVSACGLEETVEEIVSRLSNLGFIKSMQDNFTEKKRAYLAEKLEFC